MGSFDILGWGLFGGGIDKRWNFNGCGDFCGGESGEWGCVIGVGESGGKGWDCGGFWVVGRGCLAYPIFFLENISIFGNYPHFSA